MARARRSAWLGVLGAVQIPIVHFSVIWWRGLHQAPSILRPGGIQMDPPFRSALFLSLAAFTLVYAALLRRHMEGAVAEETLAARLASEEIAVAGAAVTPPRASKRRPEVSDWGWVVLAYTVTFGTIAGYALILGRRLRRTRRRLGELP